ncbi:phenolic acid decarboxylase, partial [Klebsiella pneumoniae]
MAGGGSLYIKFVHEQKVMRSGMKLIIGMTGATGA